MSGEIHLPNDHLNAYASYLQVCLARIVLPPDSNIKITFLEFDVACDNYTLEVMLLIFQRGSLGSDLIIISMPTYYIDIAKGIVYIPRLTKESNRD